MREYTLTRFNDVVYMNAFMAKRPDRARLAFKTSRLVGLWQMDLEDLESEGVNRWIIGYYIDGYEDRSIEYDIALKRSWGGYVDEELDEKLHYPPYVIQRRVGVILVTLPHEHKEEVVIEAPQVCGRTNPLYESVLIWRNIVGYFNVLDCGAGLFSFRTRDEFEDWVTASVCTEDHERPLIHWPDWFVIPGIVSGDEEWSSVVKRAVRGKYYPSPEDVITLVRKATEEET